MMRLWIEQMSPFPLLLAFFVNFLPTVDSFFFFWQILSYAHHVPGCEAADDAFFTLAEVGLSCMKNEKQFNECPGWR